MKKFEYFLQQLEDLLTQASKQKNPGLWLYQHNFRTPLFMLEALCKMYANLHNKKKFSKLKERFKFLEDLLGGIDYYDAFAKEFAADKKIPKTVVTFLQAQVKLKISSLNDHLKEKDWLLKNRRILKIRQDLAEADWKKPGREIKLMHGFYQDAIKTITTFVDEKEFLFSNIETDVHELRRKLRWLSIYPQALRGTVQLSKEKSVPKSLTKYLTKEIVSSPYNKMPDAADNEHFLLLQQNYFYALSWMIAELGKFKDNGLRILALQEALMHTEKLDPVAAMKKSMQILGKQQPTIQQLLDGAEKICKTYFNEKNLEKLVIGTAKVAPVK